MAGFRVATGRDLVESIANNIGGRTRVVIGGGLVYHETIGSTGSVRGGVGKLGGERTISWA